MVLGAASFMFAPSSCLLNYLGVTRFKFDSSPASIASSLKDASLKTTMQRSYKLGTFLLCCVQRVTYMFLETFDVIAEVNVVNTQGAYLFYRKNFFITPFVGEANGEKIKEQKKVNKHYIDGTSKRTNHVMISTGPIFLLKTWWFTATEKTDKLKYVIEAGIEHLLHLGKYPTDPSELDKPIADMRKHGRELHELLPTAVEIVKRIRDRMKITKDQPTLYGNEAEIKKIPSHGNDNTMVNMVDHFQGKEKGGKSCAYLIMSVALFGSDRYYREVRLFFYMLFSAIASMGIKSDIFNSETAYENDGNPATEMGISSFLKSLSGTYERLMEFDPEYYPKVEGFPSPDEKGDVTINTSEQFKVLAREFACAHLDYKFMGGDLEFQMIEVIFKVQIHFVAASSTEDKCEEYRTRNWRLGVSEQAHEWKFISKACQQIKLLEEWKADDYHFYVARVNNNDHFVEVTPNPDFKHLCVDLTNDEIQQQVKQFTPGVESTYYHVLKWIKERKGKVMKLQETKQLGPEKWVGPFFDPKDFADPFLDPEAAKAAVSLLDPWHWMLTKKDLVDGTMNVTDIMTLRPTSWISDVIITKFVNYLNNYKEDKRILFVDSMDPVTYKTGTSERARTRIAERLLQHDYILFVSHVNNNHFVIIEFNNLHKSDHKLKLKIADSMLHSRKKKKVVDKHKNVIYTIADVFYKEIIVASKIKNPTWNESRHIENIIEIQAAEDVETQANIDGHNCGIFCLRRMYAFSKLKFDDVILGDTGSINKQIEKFPSPSVFRIFILQCLLMSVPSNVETLNNNRLRYAKGQFPIEQQLSGDSIEVIELPIPKLSGDPIGFLDNPVPRKSKKSKIIDEVARNSETLEDQGKTNENVDEENTTDNDSRQQYINTQGMKDTEEPSQPLETSTVGKHHVIQYSDIIDQDKSSLQGGNISSNLGISANDNRIDSLTCDHAEEKRTTDKLVQEDSSKRVSFAKDPVEENVPENSNIEALLNQDDTSDDDTIENVSEPEEYEISARPEYADTTENEDSAEPSQHNETAAVVTQAIQHSDDVGAETTSINRGIISSFANMFKTGETTTTVKVYIEQDTNKDASISTVDKNDGDLSQQPQSEPVLHSGPSQTESQEEDAQEEESNIFSGAENNSHFEVDRETLRSVSDEGESSEEEVIFSGEIFSLEGGIKQVKNFSGGKNLSNPPSNVASVGEDDSDTDTDNENGFDKTTSDVQQSEPGPPSERRPKNVSEKKTSGDQQTKKDRILIKLPKSTGRTKPTETLNPNKGKGKGKAKSVSRPSASRKRKGKGKETQVSEGRVRKAQRFFENQSNQNNDKRQAKMQAARRRLEEFDSGKEAPDPSTGLFRDIPNELLEKLINDHKKDLPEEQRENWMEHAFEPSQENTAAAKAEIESLLQDRLVELETEFFDVDAELHRITADKTVTEDDSNYRRTLKQWTNLNVEINMIQWEMANVPIFHPRDSIYAIQMADRKNHIQYYYVCAKEDDGNFVCKRMAEAMVRHYMKEEYADEVFRMESEKDWVCLTTEGPRLFDPRDPQVLSGNLQPLYTFSDPKMNRSLEHLRLAIHFDYNLYYRKKCNKKDRKPKEFCWAIRERGQNRYEEISESFLQDVITVRRVTELKEKLLAVALEEMEYEEMNEKEKEKTREEKQKKLNEKNQGKGRKEPRAKMKRSLNRGEAECDKVYRHAEIGSIAHPQVFYIDMTKKYPNILFQYNYTTVQVTKIRWDIYKEKFYGIEETDGENRAVKIVPLPVDWVEQTYKNRPGAIEQIKQKAEDGKNQFIRVPVGDAFDLKPTMVIASNPAIRFPQGDQPTCAYSSLASALFYLSYTDEADAVIYYGKEYLSKESCLYDNILSSLIEFIKREPTFRLFRKRYRLIRSIDDKYDILEESKKTPEDIKLFVLRQSDHCQSHAITVVRNYIFDSNGTNCLPLSTNGLNVCCGDETFVSVASGYLFEKSQFNGGQKSKSKKLKKQKILPKVQSQQTMDFLCNPGIRYLNQNEEASSIFSSFASALFYLNFTDEADAIIGIGKQQKEEDINDIDQISSLQLYIRKNSSFKAFRKQYLMGKKVDDKYDILKESIEKPDDMKLIVLQRSDKYVTHGVAAVGRYIFDSNAKHCLPLSFEGLNVICDGMFECVAHGFVFQRDKRNA